MHAEIRVHPVTAQHRDAVLALRVHPSQLDWVGRIADMLADAEACPGCEPMAILENATVIGYYRIELNAAAVIGRNGARPDLESALGLRAFFLDTKHQGRGLGSRAVNALCDDLTRRHRNRDTVVLTVNVRNRAAVACYQRAGFEDTGTLYHGGRAGPQHLMLRRLITNHHHS